MSYLYTILSNTTDFLTCIWLKDWTLTETCTPGLSELESNVNVGVVDSYQFS